MIRDDDAHSPAAGMGDGLHGAYSIIHCDEKRITLLHCPIYGGNVQSIAFPRPMRNIIIMPESQLAEQMDQNRSGGDSVRIIIAIDEHFLARLHSSPDTAYGSFHPLQ